MGCAGSKQQSGLSATLAPMPKGSSVYLLKQDAEVPGIGYRLRWVPREIRPGPRTDALRVISEKRVYASDDQGNFKYSPIEHPIESDAVTVLATVELVLTMYQRTLARIGDKNVYSWQWGSTPLNIWPRAGRWENAYYDRSTRSLKFFSFDHPEHVGYTVYLCRSFDVVAHEAGHAILDALKPAYIESYFPETGALHEAFGDITVILALLEQLDVCEQIIAETKCDLHQHSFFKHIAEEFGTSIGREFGLRNADNNLTMSQVGYEVHDLSRVFTGAFYDVLADIFQEELNIDKFDPAAVLHQCGTTLGGIFVRAILNTPNEHIVTFREVSNLMIKATDSKKYKEIIKSQFEHRGIYSTEIPLGRDITRDDVKRVCATMRVCHDKEFKLLQNECAPADDDGNAEEKDRNQ